MGKKQTFELKSSRGVDVQVASRYKHDPDLQIEDTGEITSEDTRTNNKEKVKTVSLRSVLRFADTWDYFYTTVATIASVIHGTFMPLLMLIFGEIVDMFLEDSNGHKKLDQIPWNMYNTTKDDALNDQESLKLILEHENRTEWIDAVNVEILKDLTGYMNRYALYAIYMALAVIVMAYLQTSLWFRTSQRQGQKIRAAAFRSIMRQDMAWFDTHKSSELNNRLSEDINVIVAGIGDRVGMFIQWVSAAIAGMLIGFFSGWKLSLVVCGIVPLITIVGALTAKKVASSTIKEMNAYAEAGAVAEETIASFRTVLSFGGENKECERYAKKLRTACSIGIKKGYVQGAGPGLILGIIYGSYGICFWYGAKLIHDNEYTPGEMLTIFYAVLVGAFSLSYAFPNLQYISEGKGAASTIWNIIDSIPAIDWTLSTGACPSRCYGNIQFNNVKFAYPSRKNINVLKNVSFDVTQGQTVALVGASGCGKSTAVQLIQRFYDPDDGYIEVDGVNIRELNTQWLREQIGVVSQEPVLFGTTISQNIRFGREDVTQEEIEDACRKSNAYEFIERLPNKYETLVGERGAQLSGGQKQRIAIARALVRDPKILLLDEATSALDTESEALVQSALDKAREGRTTIVIAHRLSTIKTADIICGFDDGKIVEQGTHEELMELNNGIYCQLVKNQTSDDSEDNTDEDPVNTTLNDKDVVIDDVDDEVSSSVEDKMKKSSKVSGFTWAFKQSGPEKYYIVAGCISAILYGLKQPAYAIIFAELFAVFELPLEEQMSEVLKNCYLFLGVGAIAGIAIFLQHAMFNYSGTCLTKRLRTKAFTHLLRQDVAFFDKPENNTGAVISNLAKDTMAIQGATGAQLGMMLQGIAGMGSGAIIGFVYSWKMALGSVAFVPCIFFGGILTSRLRTDTSEGGKSALQDAAMLGFQAIENVKTVTSLSRHEWFINNYITQTLNTCKKAVKGSHLHGAVYACSQSFVFFAYGGSFYLGAYLIEEGELSFVNMMKVFMSIVFGALAMGNATRYMPSLSEGQQAAENLHKLFKNKPKINGQKGIGKKISNVSGKLEFRSVMFNYPSRHTVPVLKSFNLTVQPGEMVAFVGSSGCGKSTTVQLIERFYDTLDGAIYLDDEPIKSLDIGYLRSNFGLVSQEPVLFDTSIAENIAYGDNTRVVPMEEIIEAARKANIHDFIHNLPQGYATNVGSKGTQLSGGQKQRVAIARALIRDPKVLLLDEATSALDSESEKIVQEALEVAQQGRTSIVIAHRLSTIVNADKIVVFHRGRIVEAGTHSELLTEKGFYYRLNQAQIRTK